MQEVSTDFTMEIVLGVQDNSRSQIKYPFDTGGLFDTASVNILHCNEFRTFWVRWANAYIQVGRGPIVGEQTFMNTNDVETHLINAVGLASGLGNAAVWQVNENNGNTGVHRTLTEYPNTDINQYSKTEKKVSLADKIESVRNKIK